MNRMKQIGLTTVLPTLVLLVIASKTISGNLDAPADPNDSNSAMYTLEDAYNRVVTGATGTKRSGGFTGPTSVPGSSGGHTLDEVLAKMPAPDNTDGALPEQVVEGKTYWGLRTDGTWGQQTGTFGNMVIACFGTLNGTRWCDQGDGTVTDMTTGLVWLKDAIWGGTYMFYSYDEDTKIALSRASQVKHGTPASLTDGSVEGDWRLPTKNEFYTLTHGIEPVRYTTPRAFAVMEHPYWSSTTYALNPNKAWWLSLRGSDASMSTSYLDKHDDAWVWPVRGAQ